MQFITLKDYLLLPIYLAVIVIIAFSIRRRYYPVGHPWRPYFLPGLFLKIGGSLFIGFLYQYYYGYGDTALYFDNSKILNESFAESPLKWFKLAIGRAPWFEGEYYHYTSRFSWYAGDGYSNFIVSAIAGTLGLLTFNSFLPTTVIFAAVSYTGIWALFKTFALQYPVLKKYIAGAVLFVPSVVIWGSGIFKDTICLFALGWLTYLLYKISVLRKIHPVAFGYLIACIWIIKIIKLYILLAYLPATTLWLLFHYSKTIKKRFVRVSINLLIFMVCGVGGYFLSSTFEKDLGSYSLGNIAKTSQALRTALSTTAEESSSTYTLGDINLTPVGLLLKLPAAINVTLFRPYVWEAKKLIVLFNALEAFIFLLVFIKILFFIGIPKIWTAISTDPNLQFCVIFTLIFAYAVGISTFNFGTLSRYKIPCTPFFGLSLVLIYYRYNSPEKNILKFTP